MKIKFFNTSYPFQLCFLIIIFFLINPQVNSQISWSKVFGGISHDIGWFAKQTIDGNYLMVNEDFHNGYNLAKFDSFGNILWQKYLNDSLISVFNFAEDQNGYIYLVSNSDIIKTDPGGNILWIKNIPVIENQFFYKIFLIDSGKNLLMIGNNSICKSDTSGNIFWQKIYSNVIYDLYLRDFLGSGNFYYFAGSRKSNFTEKRAYIIKTDTSGNVIWDKYSSFTSDFYGVSKNSDKTFIACGFINNSASTFYTVKFDLNSNYIWEKNGLPDSSGMCSSIYKINPNNYVLASTNRQGKGKIIKIDSLGNVLNNIQHYYNGRDWAYYNSIMGCSDSGFIIASDYEFDENGLTDCLIIKTDKYGNATPIGIEPISSQVPDQLKLYQNYPNPFNPETKIRFEIPANRNMFSANFRFYIYDITGRVIYKLYDNKPAGVYEISFNASDLASGIYFYTIESGGMKQMKKMILLK